MLTVGSLFSGVGGFDLAFERAGARVSWQVEIDESCQRVLAHHWPDVPRFRDVREVTGSVVGSVDVMVGGFPCQDLSVAGKRAGLAGERSGLFHEFARLIAQVRPRWLCLENVPGLLSSNGGRDMGTVLWVLGKLGYGWSYRVLDAQYFDLAQRRQRVFIVGCLGDSSRAAQVLFEPESCGGHSAPSREAGQGVAHAVASGSVSAGYRYDPNGEDYVTAFDYRASSTTQQPVRQNGLAGTLGISKSEAIAYQCQGTNVGEMGTLRSGNGHLTGGVPFVLPSHSWDSQTQRIVGDGDISPTLSPSSADVSPYVAHSLSAEGADASEDGTGRGTPLVAVSVNQRREGRLRAVHGSLSAEPSGTQYDGVIDRMAVRRLLPIECARLQGFPDDWLDGLELADSTKYRMLGNAVAVPVVEWIARRMLEVVP